MSPKRESKRWVTNNFRLGSVSINRKNVYFLKYKNPFLFLRPPLDLITLTSNKLQLLACQSIVVKLSRWVDILWVVGFQMLQFFLKCNFEYIQRVLALRSLLSSLRYLLFSRHKSVQIIFSLVFQFFSVFHIISSIYIPSMTEFYFILFNKILLLLLIFTYFRLVSATV